MNSSLALGTDANENIEDKSGFINAPREAIVCTAIRVWNGVLWFFEDYCARRNATRTSNTGTWKTRTVYTNTPYHHSRTEHYYEEPQEYFDPESFRFAADPLRYVILRVEIPEYYPIPAARQKISMAHELIDDSQKMIIFNQDNFEKHIQMLTNIIEKRNQLSEQAHRDVEQGRIQPKIESLESKLKLQERGLRLQDHLKQYLSLAGQELIFALRYWNYNTREWDRVPETRLIGIQKLQLLSPKLNQLIQNISLFEESEAQEIPVSDSELRPRLEGQRNRLLMTIETERQRVEENQAGQERFVAQSNRGREELLDSTGQPTGLYSSVHYKIANQWCLYYRVLSVSSDVLAVYNGDNESDKLFVFIHSANPGYYYIKNIGSEKLLNVGDDKWKVTAETYDINEDPRLFQLISEGNGCFRIKNEYTGKVLYVYAAGLVGPRSITAEYDSGYYYYQKLFYFEEVQ